MQTCTHNIKQQTIYLQYKKKSKAVKSKHEQCFAASEKNKTNIAYMYTLKSGSHAKCFKLSTFSEAWWYSSECSAVH